MSFNNIFGLGSHAGYPNLRGWWPLQETTGMTAYDYSASGLHGDISGMGSNPTTGTGPTSWLSTAFSFDDIDDFITISKDAAVERAKERTLGGWVNTSLQNTNQFVCEFGDGNNGNSMRFKTNTSQVFEYGGGYLTGDGSVIIPTSEWHFISVHYPNVTGVMYSTGLKLFLDCNQVDVRDSSKKPINTTFTTDYVYLGCAPSKGVNGYFDGLLAGWFSFSGDLTTGELLEIYSGPEPINTVLPSINGHSAIGYTLSVDPGTWDLGAPFEGRSNGAVSYQYQWYSNNEVISGETGTSYVIQSGDVGSGIKCLIAAFNDGGNDSSANVFTSSVIPVSSLCETNKIYKLYVNIFTPFGSGEGGYAVYSYPPPDIEQIINNFLGAAQFDRGSGSTISLDLEIPALFEYSGYYVEFDIYNTSGTLNTVFGSTSHNNGILLSTGNLQIISGSTTGQIDFDTEFPTGWVTVKIINNGSTLSAYLNNNLQTDTSPVVAIDIDTIGKNTPQYNDIYAVNLNNLVNGDYLYKDSPDSNLYGDANGFWRAGSFYFEGSGNRCVADCMNGNSGWRVDLINTYFSNHKLRFLVGDGTSIYSKYDDTIITEKSWVHWYVDLRQVTGLSDGSVGFTGSFIPETTRFNLGYNRESGYCFAGKQDTVVGGTGYLTTAQTDWFFNSGEGRCMDEFTVNSTISSGLLSVGYAFTELTGIRYDSFGSNHLTESPMYFVYPGGIYNTNFETWSNPSSLDDWDVSAGMISPNYVVQESGIVYDGNYAAKIVTLNSALENQIRLIYNTETSVQYNFSIWAAATGTGIITGSSTFTAKIWGNTVNFTIQDTGFYKYTTPFIRSSSNRLELNGADINQSAVIFDNLTVQKAQIFRVDGLRTSFSRRDTFDGYLRNIKIHTDLYENGYNLYSGALDTGNYPNHGTPYNVDFVATDPDPSGQ